MSSKKDVEDKLYLQRGKLDQEKHRLDEKRRKILDKSKEIEGLIDELNKTITWHPNDVLKYDAKIEDLIEDSDPVKKEHGLGNQILAFITGVVFAMLAFSL